MSRVVLLDGPPGAGKTTAGRAAASALGLPFVDLDALVVERSGRSIVDIFEQGGEAAFRELEREALEEVLAREVAAIISLGGGSLADLALRSDVMTRALVVGLRADLGTLARRLEGDGNRRPLLGPALSRREEHLAGLLRARRAAYACVHATVDATGSPSDVAARVERLVADGPIAVGGGSPYAVRRARDAAASLVDELDALQPTSFALVTDENVERLHGAAFRERLAELGRTPGCTVVIPAGEPHKHLGTLARALEELVAGGLDRGGAVVALGGGVVTDLAGFAAATYARGVRWIAVPTTALAMIDASVGNKTGVDVGSAKNMAGAFHAPSSVLVDTTFARTEGDRGVRAGYVEALKAAAIADAELFARLADAPSARDGLDEAVAHAVPIKAAIVSRDPEERGERMRLNFGHTFGHALEAAGGFERWLHGECVAAGMLVAAALGTQAGRTEPSVLPRLRESLRRLGCVPRDLDRATALRAIDLVSNDKKRRGGSLHLVELRHLGVADVQPWSVEALLAALPGAMEATEIFPIA